MNCAARREPTRGAQIRYSNWSMDPATEWRKTIAHGASRGNRVKQPRAPEGAIESRFCTGLSFAAARLLIFQLKPTADAVGYLLPLLRSSLPLLSQADLRVVGGWFLSLDFALDPFRQAAWLPR